MLEKIGNLAYRLDLPPHWRVYPVISVTHLEPAPNPHDDPYKRPRLAHLPALSMEGDVGIYFIEKLLDRRQSRRGSGWCVEYLVRWEGYGPAYDVWYNIKDLDDAMDLIKECDERLGLRKAVYDVANAPIPTAIVDILLKVANDLVARKATTSTAIAVMVLAKLISLSVKLTSR